MTSVIIDDTLPYTQSIATGSQTVFNANWTADAASDVVVYARATGVAPNDVTQIVSSINYTVSFIGAEEYVRVTFLSGRTAGDVITITRNTPADRMNLYTNTNFTPSMLNGDFGRQVMMIQQNLLHWSQLMPRYNTSATVQPVIDMILPILPAGTTWVKNNADTAIIAAAFPEDGAASKIDTYVTLTDETANEPNSFPLSAISSGIMVNRTGTTDIVTRTLTGTSGQIAFTNGNGVSGNPTAYIVDNVILPGTAGMGIPQGSTAQRVTPLSGIGLRFNTNLQQLEYYNGGWVQLEDSSIPYLPLTGGTMSGDIDMGSNFITSLLDPVNPQDAATKAYVDAGGGGTVNAGTINQLAWYAATGDVVSGLPTANNGVLVTSIAGVPSISTTLPSGLTIPGYQSTITPAALTKVDDTNVTLSLGGTPASALLAATSLTLGWTGTLGIARGGTGLGTTPTNGQLLIGNGTNYSLATLTAGSNITITNSAGGIQIDATGGSSIWIAGAGTLSGKGGDAAVTADGNYSLAYGRNFTKANGNYCFAMGNGAQIANSGLISNYCFAFGNSANVGGAGANAFAFGSAATANGNHAFCFTNNGYVGGDYAFAFGLQSQASAAYCWAIGNNATATNTGSVVWGDSVSTPNGDSAANQFNLTFANGFRFFTGASLRATIDSNGLTLPGQLRAPTDWTDSAGLILIKASYAASAVNYLLISSNATGLPPVINAVGADTNIDFNIGGKGTGAVNILGASTNSNAPTGYVGEYISSQVVVASAVNLPNNTATNITSISLTAGDWDVYGNVRVSYTTTSTGCYAWISTTSATAPDQSLVSGPITLANGTIAFYGICCLPVRISLSATTTVYLSAVSTFTAGTSTGCGFIGARRVR